MIAPLTKTGALGDTGFVVAAVLAGVLFGFFLERGGLANARKLTGQFYLKDFTVLKVMFTAVVVAMLGLHGLALVGLLNLGLVYLNPTYVWPVIVGGLLVGFGFAVGGYCPGTAVAAAATGKWDSYSFLAGILIGIAVFAELFDLVAAFTTTGHVARPATLDSWLGVNPGLVAFLVVLMALGVFWAVAKYEARTEPVED